MLGDVVAGRRVLGVLDPDREDDIDLLERLLRRPGPLRPVSPADGERVGVGDHPLAADRGRHRGLQDLRGARQRRADIRAAHPGIDPDPGPLVAQDGDRPAVRPLVERDGVGGRDDPVVVPGLIEEVERQDHGHRPRLARAGHPEGVVDHRRDLRLVLDLVHDLADRPEQGGVGGRVDLEARGAGAAVDVGDDADDRDAVEQRLADPGHGVGQPGAGDHAEDADAARGPRRAVGHDAGRRLVGDEEVVQPRPLHGVPELVVLGPGTPKTQGTASHSSVATAAWAPVIRPRTPRGRGPVRPGGKAGGRRSWPWPGELPPPPRPRPRAPEGRPPIHREIHEHRPPWRSRPSELPSASKGNPGPDRDQMHLSYRSGSGGSDHQRSDACDRHRQDRSNPVNRSSRARNASSIRFGVLPEVPDTFEHDRPAVVDGVEVADPAVPVDPTQPRRPVHVLPTVVVVDMRRRQPPPGRPGGPAQAGLGGDPPSGR